MTTEEMPPVQEVHPKGGPDRMIQHCEVFMGLVEAIDDDASCFAAMGLCLFDLTQGALPEDPIAYLKGLNAYILTTPTIIEGTPEALIGGDLGPAN